jgi:hypothetical protein
MPRKPIDYSKCCFYRLVCLDPTVKECYVGHTTDAVKRRCAHKSKCHNEKHDSFNFPVYQFIRAHGGFDNWDLLVHEKLAVEDIIAARLRERYWCEHYKSTLNSIVPGRTIKEGKKAYYAKNCAELKAKSSAWHDAHREVANARMSAYYAANADHMKEKHNCACGGKYITMHSGRHFKTARHCTYLATLAT